MQQFGFEAVRAPNLAHGCPAGGDGGLFAGSDDERLEAFHTLARDPSIKAIVFARGGHGLLRVLPGIDWDVLENHPRAYVGYSDLTPFLNQVVERLDLTAFHGPMVASDLSRDDFGESEAASFLACLAGNTGCRIGLTPCAGTLSQPVAEGRLAGGCLSLLVATLGTDWQTSVTEKMLFLEDVGEPDYRLDRMLTHLDLSGSLPQIKGLLIGQLAAIDTPGTDLRWADRPAISDPSISPGACPAWRAQLLRSAKRYGWSVASGLEAGHGVPNHTLPLGRVACLDPATGTLEIE